MTTPVYGLVEYYDHPIRTTGAMDLIDREQHQAWLRAFGYCANEHVPAGFDQADIDYARAWGVDRPILARYERGLLCEACARRLHGMLLQLPASYVLTTLFLEPPLLQRVEGVDGSAHLVMADAPNLDVIALTAPNTNPDQQLPPIRSLLHGIAETLRDVLDPSRLEVAS